MNDPHEQRSIDRLKATCADANHKAIDQLPLVDALGCLMVRLGWDGMWLHELEVVSMDRLQARGSIFDDIFHFREAMLSAFGASDAIECGNCELKRQKREAGMYYAFRLCHSTPRFDEVTFENVTPTS